jgi:hypothetical protein
VIRLEKLKLKVTCRRSRMCHGQAGSNLQEADWRHYFRLADQLPTDEAIPGL